MKLSQIIFNQTAFNIVAVIILIVSLFTLEIYPSLTRQQIIVSIFMVIMGVISNEYKLT